MGNNYPRKFVILPKDLFVQNKCKTIAPFSTPPSLRVNFLLLWLTSRVCYLSAGKAKLPITPGQSIALYYAIWVLCVGGRKLGLMCPRKNRRKVSK